MHEWEFTYCNFVTWCTKNILLKTLVIYVQYTQNQCIYTSVFKPSICVFSRSLYADNLQLNTTFYDICYKYLISFYLETYILIAVYDLRECNGNSLLVWCLILSLGHPQEPLYWLCGKCSILY